jgi:hypothetical protein
MLVEESPARGGNDEMRFELMTLQDRFYLGSALDLAALSLEEQRRANDSRRSRHEACVVGAITCSVSFLECSINGLYEYAKDHHRPTKFHKALASVWSEAFDRLPVLSKYQIALTLARREPLRSDAEPYQSADAVIELRNAIAHPKELMGDRKRLRRFEQKLRGKYAFGPKRDHVSEFFPGRCLTADCSMWAVIAVARFFSEFSGRLPPTAYMSDPRTHVEGILKEAVALARTGPQAVRA